MDSWDSLFTPTSLLSLQGAAAASLLAPNVIGVFAGEKFDPYRKWTSLGIALALAFVVAALVDDGPVKWFVAFFNGLLIFAAAMGVNQLPRRNRMLLPQQVPEGTEPGDEGEAPDKPLPRAPKFFRSWV
ncbi:MAG: hypothetical protein ACRDXX_00900 [Stackebrandtia sp.]